MNNWKQIGWACVGIVVLVAVAATFYNLKKSNERATACAIANAESIEDLNKVIKEYSGNPAVNDARLRLALLYKSKEEYDKALAQYRLIANTASAPDEMRWRSRINAAYTIEISGKKEEAVKEFEKISMDSMVSVPTRVEAAYSAGRIYNALKKQAEAEKVLKTVENMKSNGYAVEFWKNQAKMLLQRLQGENKSSEKPVSKS
jgi:hypothetical protein